MLESRIVLSASPIAALNGPFSVDQGEGIQLDASGSSHPDSLSLSYAWGINGSGYSSPDGSDTRGLSWQDLMSYGIAAAGNYSASVQVSDENWNTDTASTSIIVNNVPPTLHNMALSTSSVLQAEWVSVSGSFSDPAFGSMYESYTYSINWGNGSTDTFWGSGGTVQFTYPNGKDLPVTITAIAWYDGQGFISNPLEVTVENVAPTLHDMAISPEGPVFPGDMLNLSGSFSDPAQSSYETYTYTIAWGDQTVEQHLSPYGHQLSGSHAYADPGSYTVTVTIDDGDGGSDEWQQEVTVLALFAATFIQNNNQDDDGCDCPCLA